MKDSRELAKELNMSEDYINDICFRDLPKNSHNQGGYYLIEDDAVNLIRNIRESIKVPYLKTISEIDSEYLAKVFSYFNNSFIDEQLENVFKKDTSGFVYIISDTDVNLIKIGRAKNVQQRLKTLSVSNQNLKLIFTKRFSNYYSAEFQMHEKFKDKRVYGEWFDVNVNDAISKLKSLPA